MTSDVDRLSRARLVADRALPPYRYSPGRNPHPTRDPRGHSFGAKREAHEPPDPEAWRECRAYLYGIDLFNAGYYWEAHEVWEDLWNACGRRSPTATFFKALIAVAAAGLKSRQGNIPGTKAHAERAARLCREIGAAAGRSRYMGLELPRLESLAREIAHRLPVGQADETNGEGAVRKFILWPR